MKMILAVSAGGAIGATARYLLTAAVMRLAGSGFPYGTLTVNIAGSFLMGVLVELLALRFSLPNPVQAFLITGVLGGFTTFSAFSLDAVILFERQAYGAAAAYVTVSVVVSIAALFAGLVITRMVAA